MPGGGPGLQTGPDVRSTGPLHEGTPRMDRDELVAWALGHGWQMIADRPCLTRPPRTKGAPAEAIVRMVLLATVVNIEVKKPAGKWEKVAGAAYGDVVADPDGDAPTGLDFEKIPSFRKLMQDNRDRQVFAGFGTPKR